MENKDVVDITGLNKASILKILHDNSTFSGLPFFLPVVPMPLEEAENLLKKTTYFDYVNGRLLKVNLKGDSLDLRLYNADNGGCKGQILIANLRAVEKSQIFGLTTDLADNCSDNQYESNYLEVAGSSKDDAEA